jgi:hypothetical protein
MPLLPPVLWGTSAATLAPGPIIGLDVAFDSTDGNGIDSYTVTSTYNGTDPTTLRVLEPASPAGGQPHRYVYLMPVSPNDEDPVFPIEIAQAAGWHDTYNATFLAPQFANTPWLGDHPSTASLKYESYLTRHLRPWAARNLSGGGEHWLVGFSKSGYSVLGVILRNPGLFHKCAGWDSLDADTIYNGGDWQFDSESIYSTQVNIYAYDPATIAAAKAAPFQGSTRIMLWDDVGVYNADVTQMHAAFDAQGIKHTLLPRKTRLHAWDSGWLPEAIDGMANLGASYDADAEALFAAWAVNPGPARKSLYSALIAGLKSDGVWTKLDFLHWFGSGNGNDSWINLKSPGVATISRLASDAATFTVDRGWTGDAAHGFSLNWNPTDDGGVYTQNSSHIGVWARAADGSGGSVDLGASGPSGLTFICPNFNGIGFFAYLNANGGLSDGADAGAGHFVANRSGASALQYYKNGSSVATGTDASTWLPDRDFYVLARNEASGLANSSNDQLLAVHGGGGLSAGDVANLYSRLNTLKAALGA